MLFETAVISIITWSLGASSFFFNTDCINEYCFVSETANDSVKYELFLEEFQLGASYSQITDRLDNYDTTYVTSEVVYDTSNNYNIYTLYVEFEEDPLRRNESYFIIDDYCIGYSLVLAGDPNLLLEMISKYCDLYGCPTDTPPESVYSRVLSENELTELKRGDDKALFWANTVTNEVIAIEYNQEINEIEMTLMDIERSYLALKAIDVQ